jgi:hypothetical protein
MGTGLQKVAARPWLDWGVALFSTWFVTGLYLDGWAHANALPDSFLTPWHAAIYSGFLGAACLLVGTGVWARLQGAPLREALPVGYGLSLLGVGLFLLGGIADVLWHLAFGIEADLEALYSPPHLLLAAGGLLIATGPWRSAWSRVTASQATRLLMVLSVTLVLAILTFFTGEFHPFVHPWAWTGVRPDNTPFVPFQAEPSLPALLAAGGTTQEIAQTLGMSSILFQSGLLLALVALVIRRWGAMLPFGWLTVVFVLNALGLSPFHATFWAIPVAGTAGIVADALYRWLRPDRQRPLQVRLFAAAVPVVLYSLYFLALQLIGGVWWPIHLWMGAIALAGLTGWLVSYLPFPPALYEGTGRG